MRTPRLLLAFTLLLAGVVRPLSAQDGSVLSGTLLHAETGARIANAILRIAGKNVSAVSDEDGRFVLRGLPPGNHTLEVRHPEFGDQAMALAVSRPGERFEVVVRISAAGMSVTVLRAEPAAAPEPAAPIRVTVLENATAAPPAAPAVRAGSVVERDRILELAGSSRNVGDLIRRAVPTLRVRAFDGSVGDLVCLEFRGTEGRSMSETRSQGTCNNPQVYMDGVPLIDPAAAYTVTAFEGLQWIQAIPPGEAGAQFGAAPYGVILIASAAGGSRVGALGQAGRASLIRSRRSTFDWELDPGGHDYLRAFLGAAAGNAAGLAAGLEVGRRCVYVEDGTGELDTTCSRAGVVGAGLTAVALPALGSALGVRWGGATNISVGRLAPALIGATMAILPGYGFSLTTVGGGVGATRAVGYAILLVGTPLLTTMADRFYRAVRDP